MPAENKPNGGLNIPHSSVFASTTGTVTPAPQPDIEERFALLEESLAAIQKILIDNHLVGENAISIEGRLGGVSGQISDLKDVVHLHKDKIRIRTNILSERMDTIEERIDGIELKIGE